MKKRLHVVTAIVIVWEIPLRILCSSSTPLLPASLHLHEQAYKTVPSIPHYRNTITQLNIDHQNANTMIYIHIPGHNLNTLPSQSNPPFHYPTHLSTHPINPFKKHPLNEAKDIHSQPLQTRDGTPIYQPHSQFLAPKNRARNRKRGGGTSS